MSLETTSSFGAMLREYRLAAGLTQEMLAERAGVSARNIQNLERGENKPLKDTARRLAEALGLGERDHALLLTAVIPVPRRRAALTTPAAGQPAPQPPAVLESPLPVGMLAVLVADVRGYTAFTHTHGDAAGAVLATRFAALAGEAVAAEAGRVVEVRGDEVLAVFTSARSALRAGVGLLARCAEEATEKLPLRAGAGLDVGEPVPVGEGYRGEALNTAARLCAQAGPGELLATGAVVGLARRVDGLVYADRGTLTLKGLSRPVRTWLVRSGAGADEPASAPPKATPAASSAVPTNAPRHNLSADLSSFIGRAREQAKVHRLLESARLVTLTGSGGVGKTRLALAVGVSLVAAYQDGVWLIELAPLADPGLVSGTVAQVLGLREEVSRPILETLISYLATKQLLLVLDNCEHLVGACAELVIALLRAAPGLRILATSREALGVAGERRYRVPSLSAPDPLHLPPAELVGSYEAVRLFVARAQERRDSFALTAQNARAVAEICARLDGVPLAIELAAARVGSLSVEAITSRLDDRFQLLTGGSRDLPPRQRTLRAALNWSWDLLSEGDRALWRRLSVFAGSWTLAAAEKVCAGDGIEPWAVLDLLDGLVNRSLVVVGETEEEDVRYRLLETMRQYGRERLATSGEEAAVYDRHLAWSVAQAEEAASALIGAEQRRWLAALEGEHDNMRAALRWATAAGPLPAGRAEAGLRLAGALRRFWVRRGHLMEGRAWLERVLAVDGARADLRAQVLEGAGELAYILSDYERAQTLYEESVSLCRAAGNAGGLARALEGLGRVAHMRGDLDRAMALYEESLAICRETGNQWDTANALISLGALMGRQGEYSRAQALYEEGLTLFKAFGDSHHIAKSLEGLGTVAYMQGNLERAQALYEEGLARYRELGDRRGIAGMLYGLAGVAELHADYSLARTLFGESLALYRELGDVFGMSTSLNGQGVVLHALGEEARAQASFEESLTLCREAGDRWGMGNALCGLGTVAAARGAPGRAQALYRESLVLCQEVGDRWGIGQVVTLLGCLCARQGQPERAAQLLGAADALREAIAASEAFQAVAESREAAERMRADLGEDGMAANWARGRAMPLDQVLALALAPDPTADGEGRMGHPLPLGLPHLPPRATGAGSEVRVLEGGGG